MSDVKEVGMITADHLKHTVDTGAVVITIGSLVQLLPAIASLLSILWMMIRIYETETVQRLLGKNVTDNHDD